MSVHESEAYEQQIELYRSKLDLLDEIIMNALSSRFEITDQIGMLKKEFGVAVFEKKREEEILKRVDLYEKSAANIFEVYKTIMIQSKIRQENI